MHPYAMHHRADYFAVPDAFRPERWLTDKSCAGGAEACIPFLAGNTSCIGRQLAHQELRIAVCAVMRRFDMSLAAGGGEWEESVRDFTMAQGGPLNVVITRRAKE